MKLYIVGFGAGGELGMTKEADTIIKSCDIIIGYTVYIDLLKKVFPDKTYLSTGMRKETQRVRLALEEAAKGKQTALVCSGDAGVYGMAGLAIEMGKNYPDVEIEVVAGVTAALSGAAVLGAPLTHDFAVISLSDLLTPWEKIEKRLNVCAMADLSIVLYNPSSKNRADYLRNACDIILKYQSEDTVCGYVRQIGRDGEEKRILTLKELKGEKVDMFTTVFIGNSETKKINDYMVTPRGYKYE